jgi:hypothetical protein
VTLTADAMVGTTGEAVPDPEELLRAEPRSPQRSMFEQALGHPHADKGVYARLLRAEFIAATYGNIVAGRHAESEQF